MQPVKHIQGRDTDVTEATSRASGPGNRRVAETAEPAQEQLKSLATLSKSARSLRTTDMFGNNSYSKTIKTYEELF